MSLRRVDLQIVDFFPVWMSSATLIGTFLESWNLHEEKLVWISFFEATSATNLSIWRCLLYLFNKLSHEPPCTNRSGEKYIFLFRSSIWLLALMYISFLFVVCIPLRRLRQECSMSIFFREFIDCFPRLFLFTAQVN